MHEALSSTEGMVRNDPARFEHAKPLRVIDQAPGQYTLSQVSPQHEFKVGTCFPEVDWETRNALVEGPLRQVVSNGLPTHLYLLSTDEASAPAFCFVSEQPVQNLNDIRSQLKNEMQRGAVPFLLDKPSRVLIAPVSSHATDKIEDTTMYVGPRESTHRLLLTFPLLVRNLVGEEATLANEEAYRAYIDEQLHYGDMLMTPGGQGFLSTLSKDLTPEMTRLLSTLDLTTIDHLPKEQERSPMRQWYDATLSLATDGYTSPREMLAHAIFRRQVAYGDLTSMQRKIGFTSGIFDAQSVNEESTYLSIYDPTKEEILEAIVEGYDPRMGLPSKAMILYAHPEDPRRTFLVVGGAHPEIQQYVQALVSYQKEKWGEAIMPTEIAQLAGTVYFQEPQLSKDSFRGNYSFWGLGVQVVLEKLHDDAHLPYTVDQAQVFQALDELEADPRSNTSLVLADTLEQAPLVETRLRREVLP